MLEVNNVCVSFRSERQEKLFGTTRDQVLFDVSLKVPQGTCLGILGESGSGKSTLMNIIGALDVPTKGEYYLGGEDVSKMEDKQLARIRNKMIGFIFQQYNLLPKLNLLENVELPLLYAGVGSEERKQRAMASLEKVGLAEKWKKQTMKPPLKGSVPQPPSPTMKPTYRERQRKTTPNPS